MFSWSPWLTSAGGASLTRVRVPPGVARFDGRSGGASLWERVPPVALWNSALRARNSALAGAKGHQGPRAGLLRAYGSLKDRLAAQQLVPAAEPRWFTERAPGPPSTFRPLAASLALVFWAGRTFCGLGCTLSPSAGQRGRPNPVNN